MKKYVTCSLLLYLYLHVSCSVSDRINKATDRAFGPMITTSVAMSQVLIESTALIYNKNSLELDESIYIHQLKVSFANKTNSFELELDSIEATRTSDSIMNFQKITTIGDSIFYNPVIIPYYSFYLENDSLELNVTCEYLTNMNIQTNIGNLKCLKTDYIMKGQKISQKNTFKECSK